MKHFMTCLFALIIITASNLQVSGQAKIAIFEEYIKKYRALAIQQQREYKIPASITLAQGLLESAAGTSRLAREGNNHFGIKCKENWKGSRIYHTDDAPNECFRRYKCAEDSYLDHSKFIAYRKYYVSLFDLDIYDYEGWARGLKRCGYATDPKYADKLIRLIKTYELYKYDHHNIDKTKLADVDPEIEIETPEITNKYQQIRTDAYRRKVYLSNGLHYIIARENDTYDNIAYDLDIKVKKLLKYNETTREHKLEKGDIVYLQKKKKYADKAYKEHIIVAGDSMYGISQLYGMKLKSLYKLNKLRNTYIPRTGDVLKVNKK